MAKVKPYIITVKYISTYSDPPPTEEQILAELNIDALEVHIQPATIAALTQVEEEIDVDSRTISFHNVPVSTPTPASEPTPAPKVKKLIIDFDTKHLEKKGPSIQVLTALRNDGPMSLADLREATGNYSPSLQVAVSRMKSQGRIKVVGSKNSKNLFAFVK
jgi:hypothetical protein